MPKKPLKKLASVFALIALASYSNSTETVSESTQTTASPEVELPVVVVTYSVIGDVVAQLVGDKAVVNVLIPDGQDPHEFQPSAKDIETLSNAAIVVSNGLDFEEGLEDVLENVVDSGNKVFMVGEHITVLKTKEADGHEHDHGGVDPHLWLSPGTMLEMLPALTSALSDALGIDLANSSAALTTNLEELDKKIQAANEAIAALDKELPEQTKTAESNSAIKSATETDEKSEEIKKRLQNIRDHIDKKS